MLSFIWLCWMHSHPWTVTSRQVVNQMSTIVHVRQVGSQSNVHVDQSFGLLNFAAIPQFFPPPMDYLLWTVHCLYDLGIFKQNTVKSSGRCRSLIKYIKKIAAFLVSLRKYIILMTLSCYIFYSELTCHLKFAQLTCSFKNYVLDFWYLLSSLQLWAAS